MWFKKKMPVPSRPTLTPLDGFSVGQLVQHKVDGKKGVVICFYPYDSRGPVAEVALSHKEGHQYEMFLAELEPFAAPLIVAEQTATE